MMRSILLLVCVLTVSIPTVAGAQFDLMGLNKTSVEIPVTADPAEGLLRDLTAAEEASQAKLDRLQERSRFFLERLDARRRDLDARETELSRRRNALGRTGPQRRERITEVLEDMRRLNMRLGRIEEAWIGHLDVLADTASLASRLGNRIEETRRSGTTTGTLKAADLQLARIRANGSQVQERVTSLRQQWTTLQQDADEHRRLLEDARARLQTRDRELLAEFAESDLGDDDDSAAPPSAPPVELSPQERELLQLDDDKLRLAVRLLERLCELDRLELARRAAEADQAALELPLIAWELQTWSKRKEALSVREVKGLLFKGQPLFDRRVMEAAADHTQALLLDPRTALEDMLQRTRRRPEELSPKSFFVWIGLIGLLGLFLSARLEGGLRRLHPRGPGEALVIGAGLAALPLLPVSLVCGALSTLGGVPDVLVPLYRFSTFGLPLLAITVAIGTGLFPGRESSGPKVDRYARGVIRIGAGLAALILLFEDALPLFDYPEGVGDLVQGLALGWALFGWLLIVLRRAEILVALGATGDDPDEGLLRSGLRRFYPVLALGPVAVYAVYAVGYANLASFLVQGGLVTNAVLLLAPWLHENLRQLAARAVGYPDGGGWLALQPDGAKAVYQMIAPLILVGVGGGSIVLVAAGWRSGERLGSLTSLVTRPLLDVGGSHVSIGSILLFGVTIVVTLLVSKQVMRLLNTLIYPLYDVDKGMQATLDTLARYVVLVTGVLVGLDVVGVGIGFLTVFAGIVGIGIGFGSQTLANNFISGLILLFARPVAVDDVIEVDGITGRVVRISAYATVVRTLDNLNVIIPNSDLVSGAVVNWSVDDPRVRLSITVGVAYGSDVALVKRLLMEAAESDPLVLRRPKPVVRFDDFADSALVFTVLPWTSDPDQRFQLASSIRVRVDKMFREHDIVIPFPQQDIHVKTDGMLERAVAQGLEVQDAGGAVVVEADAAKQKAARARG